MVNSLRVSSERSSQLLSWSFVHEGLSALNGSQKISEVRFVLDSSAIDSIVQLPGKDCSTDFLGESLTVEWSWKRGILLGAEALHSINVVSSLELFSFPMGVILICLGIFVHTNVVSSLGHHLLSS